MSKRLPETVIDPTATETKRTGEISVDDVRRVASLARLRVSDERAKALTRELAAVLRHASRLNDPALGLDGVEPLAGVAIDDAAAEPRWEADEPEAAGDDEGGVDRSAAGWRQNAPDMAGPFFRVPRVVDGSDRGGASA